MADRCVSSLLDTLQTVRPTATEAQLQAAVETALADAQICFSAQVELSPTCILDVLVGTTAVELKIDGSRSKLIRQLFRYAKLQKVQTLVLVTTRNKLRSLPTVLEGKPVHVVYLSPLGSMVG